MPGLVLPEPTTVTIAQAREIADRVERWATQTDDVDALADAQAKLGAIEAYLRRRHEAGAVEIARADRRLEVRIGVLLGPAKPGVHDASLASEASIPKDHRYKFRQIAEHADRPEVAEAIEQGASQSEVLRTVKAVRKADLEEALAPIIDAQIAEDREAIADMRRRAANLEWPADEQVQSMGALFEAVERLLPLPDPADMVAMIPAYSAKHLDRVGEAAAWLSQFAKEWDDR